MNRKDFLECVRMTDKKLPPKCSVVIGVICLINAFSGCATDTSRGRIPADVQSQPQAPQISQSWVCTPDDASDPLAVALKIAFNLNGTQVVGKQLMPDIYNPTKGTTGPSWIGFAENGWSISGPASVSAGHIQFGADWSASQDDDEDHVKYDLDTTSKRLTVNDTYVSDDMKGGQRKHSQIFSCVYEATPY